MEFYKILACIMDEKGLSIPDTARACGLPDSTIRSILTRKNKTVSLEVAFKISNGLGVTLERLSGETEIVPNSETPTLDAIFQQLSEDNRSKLTELALLYLNAQNSV
jgi:transcriptional regulator with XRE-family HTH domain